MGQLNEEYDVYISSSSDYFQAMLDDVKFHFDNKSQFDDWVNANDALEIKPGLYSSDNKTYIHLASKKKMMWT